MPNRRSLPIAALAAWLLILAGTASAQTVSFFPSTSEPADPDFTVALVLEPGPDPVLGLEVSVLFRNDLIGLDGIDPGTWFTEGDADFFFWDYTHPGTELIHFAASRLGSPSPLAGVVAVCRFTALADGISPLAFQALKVRGGQNEVLPATHSLGDRIIIYPPIGSEAGSFGAVKALFR